MRFFGWKSGFTGILDYVAVVDVEDLDKDFEALEERVECDMLLNNSGAEV